MDNVRSITSELNRSKSEASLVKEKLQDGSTNSPQFGRWTPSKNAPTPAGLLTTSGNANRRAPPSRGVGRVRRGDRGRGGTGSGEVRRKKNQEGGGEVRGGGGMPRGRGRPMRGNAGRGGGAAGAASERRNIPERGRGGGVGGRNSLSERGRGAVAAGGGGAVGGGRNALSERAQTPPLRGAASASSIDTSARGGRILRRGSQTRGSKLQKANSIVTEMPTPVPVVKKSMPPPPSVTAPPPPRNVTPPAPLSISNSETVSPSPPPVVARKNTPTSAKRAPPPRTASQPSPSNGTPTRKRQPPTLLASTKGKPALQRITTNITLKRTTVLQRVVRREKDYITMLENVIKCYRQPLLTRDIASKREVEAIFGNIVEIFAVHKEKEEKLDSCTTLGELMQLLTQTGLNCYVLFRANRRRATRALSTARERDEFANFIRSVYCEGLFGIDDFISKPINHIKEYSNILSEALKSGKSSGNEAEYNLLLGAYQSLNNVALNKLDERANLPNHLLELWDIQQSLTEPTEFLKIKEEIFLVKEGEALLVNDDDDNNNNSSTTDLKLFLFNNCVLCATIITAYSFEIVMECPIANFLVTEEATENKEYLKLTNGQLNLGLTVDFGDKKAEWITVLPMHYPDKQKMQLALVL